MLTFTNAYVVLISESTHSVLTRDSKKVEVVVKQKKLSTEKELASFFEKYGALNKKEFSKTFNSDEIAQQAKQA